MRLISKLLSAALLTAGILTAASAQSALTLGMVIGTTGPFAAGEAPLVNGTKLAVADINAKGGINGKKINLVIEDTGGEQTGAVNAFNRMIGQDPVAIMNTTLSNFVLSQIGTIQDENIPTFTGAASVQLGPDKKGVAPLFRVRTSDAHVPAAAVRFAVNQLGAKTIAVLRSSNEFGNGWRIAIEDTLKTLNMKPALIETFEGADRDLTPQLLRIKNANADVLIISGDPPNFVVAVQQIKQLGLTMKVIMSPAGVLPTTLKLYQADASNGLYGTVDSLPGDDPDNKEWADRYRKTFNIEPDYSAAEYYDGVMMIAAAITKVGTDKNALVKELRTTKSYKGVGNTYSYADKGDGGETVAIVQIENNKLKLAAKVK